MNTFPTRAADPKYRTILVPLDGSPFDEGAVASICCWQCCRSPSCCALAAFSSCLVPS